MKNKEFDRGLLAIGRSLFFMIMILFAGKAHADNYKERYCMAQNIYFESANQSFAGKLAVGHVVINRVRDEQFPNKICDVIYQAKTRINWKGNEVPIRNQCQFSWYCDGKSDKMKNHDLETKVLITVYETLSLWYQGIDITEGATHCHADYVNPGWAKKLRYTTRIGTHKYYKWD